MFHSEVQIFAKKMNKTFTNIFIRVGLLVKTFTKMTFLYLSVVGESPTDRLGLHGRIFKTKTLCFVNIECRRSSDIFFVSGLIACYQTAINQSQL